MNGRNLKAAFHAVVFAALLVPGLAQAQFRPGRWHVPEFDPAAVGVVAALIAGGGVLIARRKRR